MYGTLDLVWKPTSPTDATPPAGKAPAIVRGDDYAHTIRITDGWTDLHTFTFTAQIRLARLTGTTAGTPLASFTVAKTQDGTDLLVGLSLPNTVTVALPPAWFWDLQAASPAISTLLAGKGKTLDDVTRAA